MQKIIVYIDSSECSNGESFDMLLKTCLTFTSEIQTCDDRGVFLRLPLESAFQDLYQQLCGADCDPRLGAGSNKFLAYLASKFDYPHNVIKECDVERIVHKLPISDLWPLDESIKEALRTLGLTTIGQVAHVPETELYFQFGDKASLIRQYSLGKDYRPIVRNYPEIDFVVFVDFNETNSRQIVDNAIKKLACEIEKKLTVSYMAASVLSMDVVSRDRIHSATRRFAKPIHTSRVLYDAAKILFSKILPDCSIQKIVLTVSQISEREYVRLDLAGDAVRAESSFIRKVVDNINGKFNRNVIMLGEDFAPKVCEYPWLKRSVDVRLDEGGNLKEFKMGDLWKKIDSCRDCWIETGKWWNGEDERLFFDVVAENGALYELSVDNTKSWYLYRGLRHANL